MLLENLRINIKPVVFSNTVFNIVKHETDIKGYWKDSSGKLYIDNIEALNFPVIQNSAFLNKIHLLFASGEKCVFYKDVYNYGVLRFPSGEWQLLKNRIEIIENKKPTRKYILELLKNTEGLTVYKLNNQYVIEIYKG